MFQHAEPWQQKGKKKITLGSSTKPAKKSEYKCTQCEVCFVYNLHILGWTCSKGFVLVLLLYLPSETVVVGRTVYLTSTQSWV